MELATLIVASAGAFFTAVAALAAWRAASVAGQEARARSEPFVAMGIPRADHDRHAIIVPLKNLGLGPARLIAFQLKDDESVISARLAPGLAPMEAEDWVMYVYNRDDVPIPLELAYEGAAEDASGRRHYVHALGGDPLPMPSYREAEDDAGSDEGLR